MKGGSSRRQGGPTASDLGSEEHSHAGQSQQPGTGTPRRRSRRIAARTDSPAWRVIILTGADGLRIGQYLAGHSCIRGRDEHADAVERQLRLLSPGVVRLLGKQRRVRVRSASTKDVVSRIRLGQWSGACSRLAATWPAGSPAVLPVGREKRVAPRSDTPA